MIFQKKGLSQNSESVFEVHSFYHGIKHLKSNGRPPRQWGPGEGVFFTVIYSIFPIFPGSSWQMQLYAALDNASTIIALLSPDYVTSQVCQEEYNLALMKHIAAVSSIDF